MFGLLIVLFSLTSISGLALGNPAAYYTPGFLLYTMITIFLLNFPINTILYVVLLFGIISRKIKEEAFKEQPNTFFERVFLVTFWITFLGIFIDYYFLFPEFFIYNIKNGLMIVGFFLIFLSVLILSIFIQKLSTKDALIISTSAGG